MSLVVHRLAAVGTVVLLTSVVTGCTADPEHPSVAPLAQISMSDDASAAPNGIGNVTPAEALDLSVAALEAAGTYHVTGTTIAGSTIDISFAAAGATGSVTTDATVSLLSVDGVMYVSGDAASLEEQFGAEVDNTIVGKWLVIDATSGFSIFADSQTFTQAVLDADTPSAMTDLADIDGQPAVGLYFEETEATLWVAAAGEPLPLRFEEKGASAGTGVLTFSGFGAAVEVAAPAQDAIVDTSKLSTPTPTPTTPAPE